MSSLSILFTGGWKSLYPSIIDCLFKKNFLLKSKLRSLLFSLLRATWVDKSTLFTYKVQLRQLYRFFEFFFVFYCLYYIVQEKTFSQRMHVPSWNQNNYLKLIYDGLIVIQVCSIYLSISIPQSYLHNQRLIHFSHP